MRNYFKMKAAKLVITTPPFNPSEAAAFGADERDLGFYIRRNFSQYQQLFPNAGLTVSDTVDVYFLLDKKNFAVLLNAVSYQDSTNVQYPNTVFPHHQNGQVGSKYLESWTLTFL
jgi:hypothetical protein